MSAPRVQFLSLFVDDPAAAAARLEALLGCARRGAEGERHAPSPHPFAAEGPIVLDLGTIELALYRASAAKGTHTGDVGIGVAIEGHVAGDASGLGEAALTARLATTETRALAPTEALADGRALRVVMTPDRHFFELILGG